MFRSRKQKEKWGEDDKEVESENNWGEDGSPK